MEPRVVIVMAKEPLPGTVKTRLCPPLSPSQAARLSEAFIADTLDAVAGTGAVVRVYGSGGAMPTLMRLAAEARADLVQQCEGLLGRRMAAAIGAELERAERVVVLGSDSPDLPTGRIAEAFAALDTVDVCIGPASDGGYYLLAARARVPLEVLGADIPWGTGEVLDATRRRLDLAGIGYRELDSWDDVDDAADLGRLRARLQAAPTTALTHTRILLRGLVGSGAADDVA